MSDITGYEDWPAYMATHPLLDGDEWTSLAARLMGIPTFDKPNPYIVRTWEVSGSDLGPVPETVEIPGLSEGKDTLTITEYAWDCGFGPRNHGYLMHLTGTNPTTLPTLMHLHSHNLIKSIGAYRDLPLSADDHCEQAEIARHYRQGQSATLATLAALKGHAVFCPDTFSWGARRFTLDSPRLLPYVDLLSAADSPLWRRYDDLAMFHEHIAAKASIDLGTTYPGMIAYDDLISLDIARALLGSTPAVMGHSGGGGRATNLSALCPDISRVGVLNMMTTLAGLLPDHVATHSWGVHIPGLARVSDLPDLAANRRKADLFVLYGLRDALFPAQGMSDAHNRLTRLFTDQPGHYTAQFLDCDHDLTPEGMAAALTWLG
ncbi:MAG: hypothetical protein LBN10_11890 [Propionibacteriaceae bacterium]|jgi:hypothetical protein|nr:hypothetical protein [Propionibacteriaceae bacterium]